MDCRPSSTASVIRTMTPSPKSQTSLNHDVIIEILSYFTIEINALEKLDSNGRRNLLNLALTCQQFTEPALSVLWNCLDSMTPLFRLLPQVEKLDGVLQLNAAHPPSWSRFDFYGQMVKRFVYAPSDGSIIEIAPMTYASVARARKSLLPNLRSLYIDLEHISRDTSLHELDCLFPALAERTLRLIEIRAAPSTPFDAFPLLSILRFSCSDVRVIKINGQASNLALEIITSFPELRELHLIFASDHTDVQVADAIPLHRPFLDALSLAPHLQELELDLTRRNYSVLPIPDISGFESLRSLAFSGPPISLLRFTNCIKSRDISSLNLKLHCRDSRVSADDLTTLISNISHRWSHSMSSIRIHFSCDQVVGNLSADSLLISLTALGDLTSCELLDDYKTFPGMLNTARHISCFATKLKKLQHLRLPDNNTLSLSHLHRLAAGLSHLRTLHVSISLRAIPHSKSLGPLVNNLSTLSVGCSSSAFPVDDLLTVLIHLHRMFPYLKSIEHNAVKGWRRVSHSMLLLQSVVDDEREHWNSTKKCSCLNMPNHSTQAKQAIAL